MLQEKDLQQIAARGTTVEEVQQQLAQFAAGFPYLRLKAAAAIGNGILAPTPDEQQAYIAAWRDYLAAGNKRVVKFVPASGAATRMFKNLYAFLAAPYDVPTTAAEQRFFADIRSFAFFPALDAACQAQTGSDIATLLAEGNYKAVVQQLLDGEAMRYGHLPKGLLLFHAYPDERRTPVEEHLVEAAHYAAVAGTAHVHFTVSHDHRPLFAALVDSVKSRYEARYGIDYDISFSEQQPATDTIAANSDGTPFRNDDGTLLFRPAGHGALLDNLAALAADVVFIKNIDNVVPDNRKDDTIASKQLLAGILVATQQTIFHYLSLLDTGTADEATLDAAMAFIENTLLCRRDGLPPLSRDEKEAYVRQKLARPLRVCGVVRNSGEPGGGPFIVYNSDGTTSPQILEAAQIDPADSRATQLFRNGTHFNPVDLVCATRDHRGMPFVLSRYIDPQTGFIAHKSKDGRELLALERPGLWNGSMSDWNTLFVEVPTTTFNPVKTVNDLLRPQHQ